MLIGKNKLKMCKKALCLIFAFLLSIESMAAVVSDNDGAAFVTKAEFEALKNNFATQIENYNVSIDGKIDGAIASYLAGIKTAQTTVVKTGFETQGIENTVEFLGKNKIIENSDKEPLANNNIFCMLTTGYSSADWWHEDTQHAFAWTAKWSTGNASNAVIERDNRYLTKLYKNITVTLRSTATGYGASNDFFWYGGTWGNLTITIPEQSENIVKNGLPTSSTWPFNRVFNCYGVFNGTDHYNMSSNVGKRDNYVDHSDVLGTRADENGSGGPDTCTWWTRERNCTTAVNCADANFNLRWDPASETRVNFHWPWGNTKVMRIKPIIREADGTIRAKSNYTFLSDKTFTNNIIVNSLTGSANREWENYTSGVWDEKPVVLNDTTGSVATLRTDSETIENYYYKELKDVFNTDEKLVKGFFVYELVNRGDGYLEISLKSDTDNTIVYFSKDLFGSNIDTTQYLDCEIYNDTSNTWASTKTPLLASKTKTYKIRANFDGSVKKIYIAVSGSGNEINDFDIKLKQIGDATVTTN